MFDTMKVAIDGAGRMVVPEPVRDRLGLVGPSEVELVESDGQVVLRPVPGPVEVLERDGLLVVERGGPVVALDADTVRDLVERQRR